MASIFLSYARDDAAKAKRLAETLEAAGHQVWWDERIDAGSAFSAEIESALRDSDLVVVLWSAASAKSPWVQDEAGAGRDRGRLVPVLLEQIAPPMGFRQYQAIDLTKWTGRGTARGLRSLLDAIDRRQTASGAAPALPEAPMQPTAVTRWAGSRTMLAVALAAVMSLAALVWWSGRDTSPAPSVMVTAAPGARGAEAQEFARNIAVDLGRFRAGPLGSLTVLRDGGKGASTADYRVEVGLDRTGKNVRADISLIGAKGSQILWSGAIDGSADRIVDIKQQAAAQLGSVLSCAVELGPQRNRIKPDVLGLYLSGCSELTDNVMDQSDSGAASIFRQITQKQPNFAPAWAYLALIESNSILSAPRAERPAIVKSAKANLDRARRLDPRLEQVFAAALGGLAAWRRRCSFSTRARRTKPSPSPRRSICPETEFDLMVQSLLTLLRNWRRMGSLGGSATHLTVSSLHPGMRYFDDGAGRRGRGKAMSIRWVKATFMAATWVQTSASVAALGVLALTPSAAAAQDSGPFDPDTLGRIEFTNDLERALRQAEAARLRGDCARIDDLSRMFYELRMKTLPAEVAESYLRRWREISARPCPPESAAPPPPQARPEEPPAPPSNDAPPAEDIPTYDAEPAPPGYGGKDPTIGVPYRDPNDPMIIPPPRPEKMDTDPPPEKKASGGAAQQQEECEEGAQCEIGPDGTPRRGKRPK